MEDYDCDCGGVIRVSVQLMDTDGNTPWLCQCDKCKDIVIVYEPKGDETT